MVYGVWCRYVGTYGRYGVWCVLPMYGGGGYMDGDDARMGVTANELPHPNL